MAISLKADGQVMGKPWDGQCRRPKRHPQARCTRRARSNLSRASSHTIQAGSCPNPKYRRGCLLSTKRSLKEALDSAIDPDQLEALVKEALGATKEVAVDVPVTCKACGKVQRPRVMVKQRDWNAIKNFLQLAIEHSHGRAPTAQAPKPRSIKGRLEEMSDAELEELIHGGDPVGAVDGGAAEEAA